MELLEMKVKDHQIATTLKMKEAVETIRDHTSMTYLVGDASHTDNIMEARKGQQLVERVHLIEEVMNIKK
jgi:hypothetical protein